MITIMIIYCALKYRDFFFNVMPDWAVIMAFSFDFINVLMTSLYRREMNFLKYGKRE
jgi:hypothetical protein